MDVNKENSKKQQNYRSKIPLPMEHLPKLPDHVLTKNMRERVPLKLINSSSQTNNLVREKLFEVDCRNVTFRKSHDSPLDWEHKVFSDLFHQKPNIGDVKDNNCRKDTRIALEGPSKNDPSTAKDSKTKTPCTSSISTLQPARIKNIKRSLKRPHSRELQGLTPPKDGQKKYLGAKCRLQFGDRIVDRLQSPDHITKAYTDSFAKCYSGELYTHLLDIESKPLGVSLITSITRGCIINWLLKINGEDGDPGVAQRACWYLDSLSALEDIPLESLQVTTAACYWIAQKIHGPTVPASRLVKNGGSSYTAAQLRLVEQKVLHALDFPSQPVVPYDFITYFSWSCDRENPGVIEVASSFISLCGLLTDSALVSEYPSVLAAAAVFNAIQLLDKNKLKTDLLSNYVFSTAVKKSSNFPGVCSSLYRAVKIVGHPCSTYRAPIEHYSRPPHMTAKRILEAANKVL